MRIIVAIVTACMSALWATSADATRYRQTPWEASYVVRDDRYPHLDTPSQFQRTSERPRRSARHSTKRAKPQYGPLTPIVAVAEAVTGAAISLATQILPHPPGCPRRRFCGCGVSVKVFGRPVRDLYLAANWGRFPRATPAPGMVAYRRGHVFYIEQDLGNGRVIAHDPNSGRGLTRRHVRSLAGFIVVNPRAGRVG